jgi:hypothetical protein
MVKIVAVGIVLCSALGVGTARQESALDKTLEQSVSVHFREVSVAGVMDFLASHGINVAARTSDINLREQIALSVTDETMHDVMQAIAEALGARWKRSGNIFVLSRPTASPASLQFSGRQRHHWAGEPKDESDPEEAFDAAAETPSAIVIDDGSPDVQSGSVNSMRRASLLRLTPSGEWAVAEQWSSSSKILAHSLRPKLSIRQRKLLSHSGSLSVSDLTKAQVETLGSIWPDGKYHVISNGRSVLIKP